MAGHRFILTPGQLQASPVVLSGADWQHCRTLRLQPGEEVLLADGQGREYRARMTGMGPRQAEFRILGESGRNPESPLFITLYQGLAKGGKLDWTIEKVTELGLARFVPVVTRHSQVKPQSEGGHKRLRWQELARQAARQSGRTRVPEIAEPCTFAESLKEKQADALGILLYEAAGQASWRSQLGPQQHPKAVSLWVGPEGGFSPEEAAEAKAADIIVVGLGPRILRSETAGVVAVALAMGQWGDLLGV